MDQQLRWSLQPRPLYWVPLFCCDRLCPGDLRLVSDFVLRPPPVVVPLLRHRDGAQDQPDHLDSAHDHVRSRPGHRGRPGGRGSPLFPTQGCAEKPNGNRRLVQHQSEQKLGLTIFTLDLFLGSSKKQTSGGKMREKSFSTLTSW